MTGNLERVRQTAKQLVTDENLDLHLLAGAALTFTVLGFTGVSDVTVLTSAILALLATLALSQIRSRQQIAAIAAGHRADPLRLFQEGLPSELDRLRSEASSYLFIGESMARLVQTGRDDIRKMLMSKDGLVRVLLLDPDNAELLRAAARTGQQLLEGRIRNTLSELASLPDDTPGKLEIRLCSFVPRISVNAFTFLKSGGNRREPGGVMFIQHYEHRPDHTDRPAGDSAPVFRLDSEDGDWYNRFEAEAERMWDDAAPWQPVPGTRRS